MVANIEEGEPIRRMPLWQWIFIAISWISLILTLLFWLVFYELCRFVLNLNGPVFAGNEAEGVTAVAGLHHRVLIVLLTFSVAAFFGFLGLAALRMQKIPAVISLFFLLLIIPTVVGLSWCHPMMMFYVLLYPLSLI